MPKVLFGSVKADKDKPPERCFVWARRLHRIVKGARMSYSPHSMTAWAKEFLRLKRELKDSLRPHSNKNRDDCHSYITPPKGGVMKLSKGNSCVNERIDRALKWYGLNVKGQYTPQCNSAKAFRKKFAKLEAAIKPSLDESLVMTESGEFFTKRIGRFWWPDKAKKQLPFVIQASVNAIRSFRLKAWKYMAMNGLDDRKRPDEEDKLRMFVRHKVLNYIDIEHLIEQPLEKLFHRNCDKPGWNPDLTGEIVDTTSERFREYGRSISSAKLWDEFYTDMEESV